MNSGNILGAVDSMSASMELAFVALIYQLSAVFDAMALLSTVKALIALWGGPFASGSFSFLLFVIP